MISNIQKTVSRKTRLAMLETGDPSFVIMCDTVLKQTRYGKIAYEEKQGLFRVLYEHKMINMPQILKRLHVQQKNTGSWTK